MFIGIGDNGHFELVFSRIKAGETDPIHTDGPFLHEQVFILLRAIEGKQPAAIPFFDVAAATHGIDVPLHNMTIKPAISFQAPFEVNTRTRLECPQAGPGEGLLDGHHLVDITRYLHHG